MSDQKAIQKSTLKKVQGQFAAWPKTRKSLSPIPEALWDAAISLADSYSIHQISKGLRLNHTALKERVEPSGNVIGESPTQTTFIELLPLNQPMASAEFSLDLENKAGAKMRIYMRGHTDIDLLALGNKHDFNHPTNADSSGR